MHEYLMFLWLRVIAEFVKGLVVVLQPPCKRTRRYYQLTQLVCGQRKTAISARQGRSRSLAGAAGTGKSGTFLGMSLCPYYRLVVYCLLYLWISGEWRLSDTFLRLGKCRKWILQKNVCCINF